MLCFSLLLIVVDNTIVNVALPTLQRELGASTSELQWIVDAYILVFAGLLLSAGALGDKFGRKGALFTGLVIMGLASALSAVADDAAQLIATRAVMGVGAALVMPATLSILTNVFTDPVERGRAIALWAGTAGMAVALGPIAGGWLLEHFWWGSVFFVNFPVVAVALVAGSKLIPTSRDPHAPRLDVPGALLSIGGLTSLVWAIIEAPEAGWSAAPTLAAFGAAAVLLGAFAWWEGRVDEPMLDIDFFRNPRFSAASASITLTVMAMFGSWFLLTQYMQFVLGYSALEAGVRFLPNAVVMMVVAPTSARLAERFGTKLIVGFGLALAAGGLAATSMLDVGSSYGDVVVVMVVMSIGMALVMPPATESIMGSLPIEKAGVGSAVNDATREIGGALGVAVVGSLMASIYGGRMAESVTTAGLPEELSEVARDSLGGALSIAERLGGAAGERLAHAAQVAFVDGMGVAVAGAAVVALLGSVVAFVALPSEAPSAAHDAGEGGEADAADVTVADDGGVEPAIA